MAGRSLTCGSSQARRAGRPEGAVKDSAGRATMSADNVVRRQKRWSDVEKADFSHPTRIIDLSGKGTVDVLEMSDMTVTRVTFQPGWRWSTHAGPVFGTETCQAHHHGFVQSGRLHVEMDDGTEVEEYGAGDVWIIPPGHDGWVVGDEPLVALEFTPARPT